MGTLLYVVRTGRARYHTAATLARLGELIANAESAVVTVLPFVVPDGSAADYPSLAIYRGALADGLELAESFRAAEGLPREED